MTGRVALFAKLSFFAGWVLASVLTTLYERATWPLSFWPTSLLGAVIGYAMAVAVDAIARRVVRENQEGS